MYTQYTQKYDCFEVHIIIVGCIYNNTVFTEIQQQQKLHEIFCFDYVVYVEKL